MNQIVMHYMIQMEPKMKSITIHKVDEHLAKRIEREAEETGTSLRLESGPALRQLAHRRRHIRFG